MGTPLLLTKLRIPPPGPLHLSRARLLAQLALRPSLRLALVAAPAGCGKSTLLGEWARQSGPQGVAVAWYTLDPSDDDPLRFLAYLTQALAGALGQPPALAALVQGLLRDPQTAPELILAELINALALAGRPGLIVLDDYHRIGNPAIHTALSFLIDHLPPGVCLGLGSRADPPLALTRLRARGQLAELRAADLRFTRSELDAFLAGAVHAPLAEADLQQIDGATEGWAASIQLIALALERPATAYATTVRQVLAPRASGQRQIFAYLADEVFAQQSPEVQHFLLATSVLERMCAELCDVVVKEAGGGRQEAGSDCLLPPASRLLSEIERANLFLIPLDDERRWYRYHHLFAAFLRERLQRDQADLIPELHRRASAWFAGQAAGDDLSARIAAVQHALAARAFALAARLIDQTVATTMARGELALLLGWLAALPGETLQEWPQLALTQARALLLAGQFAGAEERLAWVERRLPADAPLHGIILTHRATIAAICGASAQALILAAAARARVPAGDQPTGARIAFAEAMAHLHSGALPSADHAWAEAARLAQAAGQLALALEATGFRSIIAMIQGRLHTADRLCAEAIALAEAAGLTDLPAAALVHQARAMVCYEWGQLAAAELQVRQGIALRHHGGMVGESYLEYPLLALVLAARGDRVGAAAAAAEAAAVAPTLRSPSDAAMLAASLARTALLLGDLSAARGWAERVEAARARAAMPETGLVAEHEDLQLARVWLALGRTAEAAALARACGARARDGGGTGHQITALALLALADPARSQAALVEALRLAAPEGYMRTFVDLGQPLRARLAALRPVLSAENDAPLLLAFCDRLLAAFAEGMREAGGRRQEESLPAASYLLPPLAEPLSERELEVLRLLAAGLSNATIAGRLVIALPTVKTHLAHIYQKLGVSQREQAVELARAIGLV